ncbi:Lipoprotein-anchoring transpeptidase ErfK/SrfK [Micromonospora pattaloongensis]|uniref:Lipoprotein-anchoring transpeptidase ErfK/SrfK n=2 Tax=Micromonospora pattaloongensis TaxID=405436 RepID=A0A1H3FPM8_9ACTN|nr:Lipoprotein-anchoring transpeptidase ErfK/SrfK [Micromonospora pattaloongensis]
MVAALVMVAPLALVGCATRSAPRFVTPSPVTPSQPAEPFELAITPAEDAKNVPASAEVGATVRGGKITSVRLAEVGGPTVRGQWREDGSSWVPAVPLKHAKRYAATVTATSSAGETVTKTTTFSTMARPSSLTGTGLYLHDGGTYGVAMPVVVEFVPGVPAKQRAAVQKRLFVTTDPPQPGAWHWVANGTQVYYRAPEFWRPGTKLSVRVAVGGHPTGSGRYGDTDRSATAEIGEKLVMTVDNATKKMSVYRGDKLVRTMPVSLGKPKTPSSSGTMVVMEKKTKTVFDTFAELGPEEGYRTNIEYAQRLTWGGEFIHAAPWSVGDQGVRNVSHGCVNLSVANAAWLFNQTKVGDPITVKGTEVKLVAGNGWTAWNLPWDEFVKGSALPVTVRAEPAPGASGSTTP